MKEYLEELNEEQLKAVETTDGPIVLLAGAGSGKTRTIMNKIAHLIVGKNVDPSKILAVTFTNKAAEEMRERIIKLVGAKAKNVWMSTFHSLCVKILREEHEKLGIPRKFNIIDGPDQKMILSPIYKKYDLSIKTHPYNSMISYISKNKILKNSPEYLKEVAETESDELNAMIYGDYMNRIKAVKSLDFDDLLLYTERLLESDEALAKKWSDKFEYVLVDEFQDTSNVQYNIVKMLSQHNNITIVGDPDQTIYTWRQADSSLLNQFQKDFKGSQIIKLELNYRSTKNILFHANMLIKNNANRIEKVLKPVKGDGDIVEYYHAFSEDAESRWVVQKINELRKNRTQLKDIAILYRANYLSGSIERALVNENINYTVYGGTKFYQRQEIKDAIAYLKLLDAPDDISLERVINVPARKIGKVALTKLKDYAKEVKKSLHETISDNYKQLPVSPAVKEEIGKFINLIWKYRAALKSYKINVVLKKLLFEIGYFAMLNTTLDENKLENLKEFISLIEEWETRNGKGATLEAYLEEIALMSENDTSSRSADYVRLMTVHAAKGLEFPTIFMIGFSEGIFPSKRAMDETGDLGLQEERRLAYVAITRAKERLYLSNARGFSIDHEFQKIPSRFIKEMGIDLNNFTKEFLLTKDGDNYAEETRDFVEGDVIRHIKFGVGTIVKVDGDVVEISFADPHGSKTLMKNHKSIERA